jgi:hypothetical protein
MIDHDGKLVVCGSFQSIDGVAAKGIAAWDGHAWAAMDEGLLDAETMTISECEGVLYAGGYFNLQNEGPTRVVRWDGQRWHRMSDPPGPAFALGCAQGALVAGGYFYSSVPGHAQGVVRWDGPSWSPLGSGTNDGVRALCTIDDQLYVGGWFTRAGGHASSGIGRWDLGAERRTARLLAAQGGVPNPFRFSTSLVFRLAAPGRVKVTVYDLRGHRVTVLDDAWHEAGAHTVTWDGRSDRGVQVHSGVYFVRIDVPGRSETRRVVRIL